MEDYQRKAGTIEAAKTSRADRSSRVVRFKEKLAAAGWINGGFLVLGNAALDYLEDDSISLELDCLVRFAPGRALWKLW